MDPDRLKDLLAKARERLAQRGDDAATVYDEGAAVRVEATGRGTYRVLVDKDEGEPQEMGEFRERRLAYLCASAVAAASTPHFMSTPRPVGDEVREAGMGPDPDEADLRFLVSLLRSPAALEFLIESVDPEVLDEVLNLLAAGGKGGPVN